jgi:hypothetical protein
MPTFKSNGDLLEGTHAVPSGYPDPYTQNVNCHPMDWAYGHGNALLDVIAPTAPTGLASPAHTTTTVNLTWNASTDNIAVVGYDVYRGATKVATVTGTSTTVTGLTTATQYTFTVRAKDGRGNVSAPSNAVSVTTA